MGVGGLQQVDKGKGGEAANWKSEEEECHCRHSFALLGRTGLPKRAAAYKRKKKLFFSPLFEWGMDVCVVATSRRY